MTARPASDHRIRRSSAKLLGAERLTTAVLATRLRESGLDLGDAGQDRVAAVLDDLSEFMAVGDAWVSVPAQLDSFPHAPGLMDADRLRRALGL